VSRPARAAAILIVLGVTACGGDDAVTTTTVMPTTASTSATTTTSTSSEVEIPGTGILKLRPVTTYLASRFWVPVSLTVEEDAVWWAQAAELWVHLEYHEGGGSTWDLDVSIVAHGSNRPIAAVVEGIAELLAEGPGGPSADPGVILVEPSGTTIAGFDALVLDVSVPGAVDPNSEAIWTGHSRFAAGTWGVKLLEAGNPSSQGGTSDRQWGFGVRLGRAARIWVVDVDGTTITLIAATRNQELFDEWIPVAEEMLAGIEFHP
jgi:hypothetical protein